MTTIYSPVQRGFDERLAMIDRCQIALLREIVGQYGAGRLFLKGGMAMRAVFGSLRLTKDIDFDRDPSLSLSSAKDGLRHAIVRAAANAGIRQPEAQVTKASGTTVRVRLAGRSVSGIDLRFEVEVSGRGLPAPRYRRKEMVIPPASYGIAPRCCGVVHQRHARGDESGCGHVSGATRTTGHLRFARLDARRGGPFRCSVVQPAGNAQGNSKRRYGQA